MPGRRNAGGRGRGKGHGGGEPMEQGAPAAPGRSEWSPGHLKKEAGAQSARDYAPGHGGEAPGRVGEGPGHGDEAPGREGLRRAERRSEPDRQDEDVTVG